MCELYGQLQIFREMAEEKNNANNFQSLFFILNCSIVFTSNYTIPTIHYINLIFSKYFKLLRVKIL